MPAFLKRNVAAGRYVRLPVRKFIMQWCIGDSGVMVIMAASQAVDPGSIPGCRIRLSLLFLWHPGKSDACDGLFLLQLPKPFPFFFFSFEFLHHQGQIDLVFRIISFRYFKQITSFFFHYFLKLLLIVNADWFVWLVTLAYIIVISRNIIFCIFFIFLIVTFLVLTLSNVVMWAVLSYVSLISYCTHLNLNCNVFSLTVIPCKTLKKKGRPFWNIGI